MIKRRNPSLLLALLASALLLSVQAGTAVPRAPQQLAAPDLPSAAAPLSPTDHPPVPEQLDAMWYVPAAPRSPITPVLADLARGVRMLGRGEGDPAEALRLVGDPALAATDVAPYARYYTAIALARLSRLPEAEAAFAAVAAQNLPGFLAEAATMRQGEVREARGDYAGAEAIFEALVKRKLAAPPAAWLKLGTVAELGFHRDRAREAYRYVLDTYPLTPEANEAELGLDRIGGFDLSTPADVSRELARADALFTAGRSSSARSAYERLREHVEDRDKDLVALRLAEIDLDQGRARAAREVLTRYARDEKLGEEAQFALLAVARDLGQKNQYRSQVREFVTAHPTSNRAEAALNDLAVQLVRADDDAGAADVFRELVERFPAGNFAERAAWKAGWWAYRARNYADAVKMFERAAATFPRSDYRPAWFYWSARAYDGLGDTAAATDRYRLTATDYLNTYYGRLSWTRLQQRNGASVTSGVRRASVPPPPAPPSLDRISRLIELELYFPALAELQYAQRMYDSDSPALQATIAFVQYKLGNLRLGINAMKRAYPQYMAAGGESLPREILQVIYPIDYWPMVQKYARDNDLDPYVLAALMAQESTFDTGIVSAANAIGLMQVMSATGGRYARKLGISPFSPARLTDPEVNTQIGTSYFAELVRMFGGQVHYAIAAYNAGENRVAKWRKDKPDLEQDEFIDDIPYPETQNYVKRILSTADDYRRLYGDGREPPAINRAIPGTSLPQAPRPSSMASQPAPTTERKSSVKNPVGGKGTTKSAIKTKKAPEKKSAPKKKR